MSRREFVMSDDKKSSNTRTKRDHCIVCQGELLDDLVIIGEQYPSAIFPEPGSNYTSVVPQVSLNVTKCSNSACGLVQLSNEFDLDYVFENYPFVSGTTATMSSILDDVVKDMERTVHLVPEDVVLDVGGNDGTLLSAIRPKVKARVNIDAAHGIKQVVNSPDYVFVQGKFSTEKYLALNLPLPKMIFSTAMFYHLSDPVEFTRNIRAVMTDETVWCIQMTYLGSMLESNIYDNIVHEHVAYYSLQSLEYLMNSMCLEIIDAQIVKSYGGSIRVKVMKKLEGVTRGLSDELLTLRDHEFRSRINSVRSLEQFNERIQLLREITREIVIHLVEKNGKMVALGASTKGNMLCQYLELSHEQFECVIDNNEKKTGLVMTGSDIPVANEKDYLDNLPEYLFVLPYYYIEFFQKLIRKHLRKGQRVTLLVPLPKPHFVELTG